MRQFDFTARCPLSPAAGPGFGRTMLDVLSGPLFARFEGDVVPAVIGSDLVIECSIEAETLRDAVREVSRFLESIADTIAEFSSLGLTAASGAEVRSRPSFADCMRVEASASDFAAA